MLKELPQCPVKTTVSLIGSKWKTMIIYYLLHGTKRFGELKNHIGDISQKVLTQNLRDMESDSLIIRKVFAEVPPRVEYSLTDTGKSLYTVIEAMNTWGAAYQTQIQKSNKK